METVRFNGPDNKNIQGKFYIIPLELFQAKGVRWTRQLVFEVQAVATKFRSDQMACCYFWGNPKHEIVNAGNVGSFAIDGSGWKDCMCDECVEGRKEVAAGWIPS